MQKMDHRGVSGDIHTFELSYMRVYLQTFSLSRIVNVHFYLKMCGRIYRYLVVFCSDYHEVCA